MKEVLAKHRTDYRDQGKEYHKGDGQIKDQTLYATPCLKDGTCTAAPEGTTQSRPPYLEQDEQNHSNTENDLHYAKCWKPLGHDIFLTFAVLLSLWVRIWAQFIAPLHCMPSFQEN